MKDDLEKKQASVSSNNIQQVAAIIDALLNRVQATHKPGDIAVSEEWIKVHKGTCRVAAIISTYGTHIEIGPLQGAGSRITRVFREQDRAEAEACLVKYFDGMP